MTKEETKIWHMGFEAGKLFGYKEGYEACMKKQEAKIDQMLYDLAKVEEGKKYDKV